MSVWVCVVLNVRIGEKYILIYFLMSVDGYYNYINISVH